MNIAQSMAWLKSSMFKHEGVAASYVRGDVELSVTVIRGRSRMEVDSGDGVIVRMESPDYLVRASEIATLGKPLDGDRIIDDGIVYQVMPADGNDSSWQWADLPNRAVFRIHTKQIDTEGA